MRNDQQPNPVGFIGVGPTANPGTEEVPPLYISSWHRMVSSFASGAISGNFMTALRAKRDYVLQADESTPILTNDQVDQMKKERPGIVFPTNVRESTANAISKDYDQDRLREDMLNSTQPNKFGEIAGGIGRFVGSTLGSPIKNIAVGALTDEIPLPKILGTAKNALGESLAQRSIYRIASGAAQGAKFGTVQSAADDVQDILNGESFSPVENLHNIAVNMAFGGFLHPISGFLGESLKPIGRLLDRQKMVDEDGSADVNSAAAYHTENGQDPNVEMPINNAVQRGINNLHAEMKDAGLSKEEVLNALDAANENISKGADDINEKITNLVGDKDETDLQPSEKAQLTKWRNKLQQLDVASKAQEAYRFMVNNDDFKVTNNQYQQYGNQMDNPKNDFAMGRGHEDLDDLGAPQKNEKTLFEDRFPDDVRKELLKNSQLSRDQRDELDRINGSPKRIKTLRSAINKTIMCLTGS